MIKVGDVVVSNGTIADVESYLGNKPHEVLKVGKMAGVSFDMVWLDGKAIPCPADGLRVVSGPKTSMPDHNRAAFDAAHELELSKNASKKGAGFGQLGDCAKLREALQSCLDTICRIVWIDDPEYDKDGKYLGANYAAVSRDKARAALAAPARNCDVGTAEEQGRRFDNYCFNHRTRERCCEDCPVKDAPCCELAWSQMPYEEGGEK